MAALSSMTGSASTPVEVLHRLRPSFTKAQAQAAGLTPRALYALRDEGSIVELSRGVYRDAQAPDTIHLQMPWSAWRLSVTFDRSNVITLDQ